MLTLDEITALWIEHKGRVTPFARAIEKRTASAAPAEGREDGDERAMFEYWAAKENVDLTRSAIDYEYVSFIANVAWSAWHGRASLSVLATAPTMSEAAREAYAKGYYDGCLNGPSAAANQSGGSNDVQIPSNDFGARDNSGDSASRDFRLGSDRAATKGESDERTLR